MKIAVALSGGVDSTAVAMKLKRAGHEVIGLTMQLCPDLAGLPNTKRSLARLRPGLAEHGCAQCVAPCACLDGTEAARRLGVSHKILDLRKEFEERVINPFVNDFTSALTPNPCAICNRQVKFGILKDLAQALGAEVLATGHYAQLSFSQGRTLVSRARDRNKDQTYFMSLVPREQFRDCIFPLGGVTKLEIEKEMSVLKLQPRHTYTSTEICFLRELNYADFIRQRNPEAFLPGEIIDLSGRVVGEHQGLPGYTIGQRRGLGIAAPKPLYVVKLLHEKNQVVIGEDSDLLTSKAELVDVNWLAETIPANELSILAQIRYRQEPVPASITFSGEREACLVFKKPVRAMTPGQIAAFYDKDLLLGGGKILTTGAEG